MLELLADAGPMALPLWAVLLWSVAMYPLGFLFGACSECCGDENCICGTGTSSSPTSDASQWCCLATHPAEITVRLTAISGTDNDYITLHCDELNGDYVLQKTYNGGNPECDYSYVPTCDAECPVREEGDPELPFIFKGLAIFAYPGARSNSYPFFVGDTAGENYSFSVEIRTHPFVFVQDHCELMYGIPATTGPLAFEPGIDVILAGHPAGPGNNAWKPQEFSEPYCDMSGQYSQTLPALGNLGYSSIPQWVSEGFFVVESLLGCNGSVVSYMFSDGDYAPSMGTQILWMFDDDIYPECEFTAEIV